MTSLKITGIEHFPNNSMKIFNRWGILVYETDGYGGDTGEKNVFTGLSQGRITLPGGTRLPIRNLLLHSY